MLSALFKKQLLELNSFYFQNRKTGKRRSKAGIVGMIALFVFLFGYLGVIFYLVASLFTPLLRTELAWLYDSLLGMIALLFGVLGSVFNTYAGLYRAKDNDLLLSMPIPSKYIVLVRVFGVGLMGMLYECIVLIPTLIAKLVQAPFDLLSTVFSVLLIPVIGVLVTVLACLFGWIVALISSRFKNRTFLTVIFALIFFAAYYYFFSQAYSVLQAILAQSEAVGRAVRSWLYPFYAMGLAANGNIPAMVLFTLGVAVLMGITYYLLSRTFVNIAAKNDGTVKKVYHEQAKKPVSVGRTLFYKEWRRYVSSSIYMLNCSLGTFLMPVVGILALVYRARLERILQSAPVSPAFWAVLVATMLCVMATMNDLTAPSVSLEGNSLWVLQSMPVRAADVFRAKLQLHELLTAPPLLIMGICLCIVFRLDVTTSVSVLAFSFAYMIFAAVIGLILNLRFPNLHWTNETVAVKQSTSVLIALFGSWLLAALFALGGYFAIRILTAAQYCLIGLLVFALITRLLRGWLYTKGARILETL